MQQRRSSPSTDRDGISDRVTDPEGIRHRSGTRRLIRKLVFSAAVTVAFAALLEGAASFLLLARELLRPVVISERFHTEYDAELGWVNLANFHDPDHYGPGRGITTNARGTRGNDVSQEIPAGKRRVICSGDSFTLGYGVDDQQTWVHQLSVLAPHLETVNMGQGGYGIDQAFLWFRRDAGKFDFDLHLFAFVFYDFARMARTRLRGYGKPKLELGPAGQLITVNTPVPRDGRIQTFFYNRAGLFQRLAVIRVLRSAASSFRRLTGSYEGPDPDRNGGFDVSMETWALASAVFSETQALDQERGSRLILVFLPTKADSFPNATDQWRELVRGEADRLGCGFVDLIPRFRTLDTNQVEQMFIRRGEIDYTGSEGHYNAAGNRRIAEWLVEALPEELGEPPTSEEPSSK